MINNLTSLNPDRHFVVLVSYEDRIGTAHALVAQTGSGVGIKIGIKRI